MTGARLAPTAVGIVGIFGPRVTAFSTAVKFARRQLVRRRLRLVVEVNVILLVERLVAVEAGAEIGAGIYALVGLEGLVLPLAVAHVVGVLGAPARALFHHRVADEVALDEAAVGVLFRIALGVELGGVLQHGDHGAGRQRLAFLGGVERRRAGVELAELLVVGAIDRGEKHAPGVVLRKGDLVAAGAHRAAGGERRERAGDGRNGDGGADGHGVSPLALAAPGSHPCGCSVWRTRLLVLQDIRNPPRRL